VCNSNHFSSPLPWQPSFNEFDCSRYLHRGGITQYLSFCDWLISHSIMSSRFIHIVAGVRIPYFLKLNSIPSCVYTTFCSPILLPITLALLPPVGRCEECCCEHECPSIALIPCFQFFWVYIYKWNCSIHMVILFLAFWGTATLFSTAAAPFYIPINSARGFRFFHSCRHLFSFFLNSSHSNEC